MKKLLFISMLVLGTLQSANATIVYTDTFDAGGEYLKGTFFGADDSISWQFNILDDGYNPTEQEVTGATVGLNLQDDSRKYDWWEFASIKIGSNKFFWEVDTGTKSFVVDSLMVLSNTGLLDVTLTARLGDFYFNSATLTATTELRNSSNPKPTSVPEPASLALLGLGLIGLGFSTRKAKSKT